MKCSALVLPLQKKTQAAVAARLTLLRKGALHRYATENVVHTAEKAWCPLCNNKFAVSSTSSYFSNLRQHFLSHEKGADPAVSAIAKLLLTRTDDSPDLASKDKDKLTSAYCEYDDSGREADDRAPAMLGIQTAADVGLANVTVISSSETPFG